MSDNLLDQFAMAALQGQLSNEGFYKSVIMATADEDANPSIEISKHNVLAAMSYKYAQAMFEERKKHIGGNNETGK